ncbi:MAG: iron export ABC transporter permease subunit FetB [Spartobacteria bacterium]|nr:iron export ABC transporter permease subunit FetB [Spartobacteria bacterium]
MDVIALTASDLSVMALLVVGLALLSFRMRLGIGGRLLIAALRTIIQLTLIGLILKWVFGTVSPLWIMLITLIMLSIAGFEVMQRQQRRLSGWWGFGTGIISMFISSFALTVFALHVVISVEPWYNPQYAIPLLGMSLGNTMNGISLGLDRLTDTAWRQREVIEARLILGQPREQAISDIRRNSISAALTPIINTMSVVGIVSLPGMMTGQILAGSPPMEAVKYQILIMFLIATGTGLGSMTAIAIASRRLFDHRHRLRLDRLTKKT